MKRTLDDLINGNCSTYDVFERGLTEEEFKRAREKMMNNVNSLCRKVRNLTYERYYDWTHIMTKDGVKVKPVEVTNKELQNIERITDDVVQMYMVAMKRVLDTIRAEVTEIDTSGLTEEQVKQMALDIIDSYKAEDEEVE